MNAQIRGEEIAHIDRVVAEAILEWEQPGLAIAVTNSDRTLHCRGFGVRRSGSAGNVDENTIFGIGSCTKPFAAASIALLVDEGRLTWDDRVVDHLPDFQLHDARVTHEVTVRDLLSMRAGISSAEHRHRRLCVDRVDYIRRMRYQPPIHKFREQYSYWTDGFTILGELVSRLTEQSWAEFAKARIWQPLGMHRTNADHRAARSDANSAAPHEVTGGQLTPISWVYEDHVAVAAGGVNASVRDLAMWLQLMLGKGTYMGSRLISKDAIQELLTPHTCIHGKFADDEFSSVVGHGPGGIRFPSYALGWYVHDYLGETVLYHTGKIDGFRAVIGILPDRATGIAVLVNSTHYLMQLGVFQSIVDIVLGVNGRNWCRAFLAQKQRRESDGIEAERRLSEARIEGTSPTMAIDQYAGNYTDDGCYGSLEVITDGDRLTAVAGTTRYRLLHWHYDVFEVYREGPYVLGRDGFARFSGGELGKIDALQWPGGTEFTKNGQDGIPLLIQ